eukprot:scaffold384270_cov36-Prasinocladus_malaysianus.AAC.1
MELCAGHPVHPDGAKPLVGLLHHIVLKLQAGIGGLRRHQEPHGDIVLAGGSRVRHPAGVGGCRVVGARLPHARAGEAVVLCCQLIHIRCHLRAPTDTAKHHRYSQRLDPFSRPHDRIIPRASEFFRKYC